MWVPSAEGRPSRRKWLLLSTPAVALLAGFVASAVVEGQAYRAAEVPGRDAVPPSPPVTDPVGDRLAESFKSTGGTGLISPDLPFLAEFAGPRRQLLLRHLETSAAWYVFTDHGKLFAYRRAVESGQWFNPNNGYVASGSVEPDGAAGRFGYRILLGLDGAGALTRTYPPVTAVTRSGAAPVPLVGRDDGLSQGDRSYLQINSTGAIAEIFETSARPARPFTAAAVGELRREFDAVLRSPVARANGFDPALLPAGSVVRGESGFTLLSDSFHDHLYSLYGHFNPGESGLVHLRAVHVAGLSPVAVDADGMDPVERIGWSADPHEQFFCNVTFRLSNLLSENLPVRIEVWFTPDVGGPDRKLAGRTYAVQMTED